MLVFSITYLLAPIYQLLQKEWIPAAIEAGLLAITVTAAYRLSMFSFTSIDTDNFYYLGSEIQTTRFDTASLLLMMLGIWALYFIGRFLWSKADYGDHFLDRKWVRGLMLLAGLGATAFYFLGIHTPIFKSTWVWLFEDEMTLVASVRAFMQAGEGFVGIVVLIFTLIFPVIKLIYMFWVTLAVPGHLSLQINKILSVLGKFSMLDVFVVALLLLNMKMESRVVDMELKLGVVYFTLSILLNMLVSATLVMKAARGNRRYGGA